MNVNACRIPVLFFKIISIIPQYKFIVFFLKVLA